MFRAWPSRRPRRRRRATRGTHGTRSCARSRSTSRFGGYAHCMTKGERAGGTDTTGVGSEDHTWEFCLADADSEDE
jgi:hypothetical protein